MGEPNKPMGRALQMEKGGSGGSMASQSGGGQKEQQDANPTSR